MRHDGPGTRKLIVVALCAFLLALGFPAEAQQLKKVFRIGYLSAFDVASDFRSEPIRAALRDLGYIEGQNIAIEYRYAEGNRDRASAHAAELVVSRLTSLW